MFWALVSSLAIFLTGGATPSRLPAPKQVNARLVAVYWGDRPSYDPQAEKDLLDLVNRTRERAGLPRFQLDEGLSRAAREHASAMAARQQLSHQFPDEPALASRLAENCRLYLVEAAENVASAESVDLAHDTLMRSPPHRENLLHPSYNSIGIGIVRRGDTLYVVQDFGHSLPAYSSQKAEDVLAASVARARAEAHLPLLRRESGSVQKDACAMAAADSLKTGSQSARQGRYTLRYTTTQPEVLPAAATKALTDTDVSSFTVGTCFARTHTYPNGIYWIVLLLD